MAATETSGRESHSSTDHEPSHGDHTDARRITELVRSHSLALVRSTSVADPNVNPFLDSHPELDPNSPQFNARTWAKTLIRHSVTDPDRYPRNIAGVAYRNLSVHGYGEDTDYQRTVLNLPLQAISMVRNLIFTPYHRRRVDILRNFDGLVENGEMLLVLGRPGSGVSTLLKTIAGETKGLHVDPESHFNFRGIPMQTMHKTFKGEVIYQAEEDIHFPHLSVGQTLQFASRARTPKNRLPGVSREHYATHLRDVVMAVFGISHTINTKVGNEFVRGVSGGERKRVSIAEVVLCQSPIQCWDNSTRGLDSATALEFARTLRSSTEIAGTTAIVAMYQASQAAYDTFDKVAVLYEGRQIYFGHKDLAKQYFIDIGYHCPERQTTADFLTSLTNPAERIVREGFHSRVPKTPDEFARAWETSEARRQLLRNIDTFEDEHPMDGKGIEKFLDTNKAQQASWTRPDSPYRISVPMQVKICMIRGFQRLMAEKTFALVTVAGNAVISIILGSVFFDLPETADGINSRCVVLFFSILFNGLSSALEILSLYSQRPIVRKHARYALYHPFAEAMSSMICDLPTKIFSTICFNVPVYFMANLRQDAGSFFTFLLFGFTCTLTMSMILRSIGQISRTVHQALTPAAIFILALIIYTGFVLPTRMMQGWLRWINYINPIAYGFEALVVNELSGRRFPCIQFVPAYPDALPSQRSCSTAGAQPGDDFVDGGFYMNAVYKYYDSHLWRNFGILAAYVIFFMIVYLLAAEYIASDGSKGEKLVFQNRRDIQNLGAANIKDEETAPGSGAHETPSRILREKPDSEGPPSRINVLHWRSVCYDITIKSEPRRILDDVSGWVKPGTLTALMGATGAGKTTLLDVLANRVTVGVVRGDMSVNGVPRGESFQRQAGYVQQQDIHLPTSTVREALRFSAVLRQPKTVSKADQFAYVEEVIELLEMGSYANAVVGVPGEGLNIEQRKRLTIGVELAAKPNLLFLDEPTSGLDSQTAWSIATLIRKLSDNGQAVLCTIHQPSAMLFQQFDRILLLAKGGKTVYFGDLGEGCRTLIDYFESNGAPRCEPHENPAEWMLNAIGAAPGSKTDQDWPLVWQHSEECEAIQKGLADLEDHYRTSVHLRRDEVDNDFSSGLYASTFYVQLSTCLERVFQQYWRTPSYIYAKLVLSGGIALFIGVSFYNAELSMQGLQNQMFAIFMLLVVFAFLVYQAMPNFILQRDLYEARERSSRMYSWIVFMLSNIIVELPWNSLAALIMYLFFYYLVGMHRNAEATDSVHERGALMLLLMWAFMLFESTFANMVVAGVDMAEVGAVIALILFAFSLIFCGVMVPKIALPGFWIFMYRVSPMTYLVSAFLSTGLAGNEVRCSEIDFLHFAPPNGTTCGEYLEPFMKMAGGRLADPSATEMCQFCSLTSTDVFLSTVDSFYGDRWRNYGILWAYILFNTGAALLIYWLVRVPKR